MKKTMAFFVIMLVTFIVSLCSTPSKNPPKKNRLDCGIGIPYRTPGDVNRNVFYSYWKFANCSKEVLVQFWVATNTNDPQRVFLKNERNEVVTQDTRAWPKNPPKEPRSEGTTLKGKYFLCRSPGWSRWRIFVNEV